MPIEPIPVTFHVRADSRLDPNAQRRRARPYRVIVQAVGLIAALGAGFGFLAGSIGSPPKEKLAATPAVGPRAVSTPLSFPVWRPQAQAPVGAPASRVAAASQPPAADPTPVGAIRDSGAQRPRAFPPVERAPDYAGFKVIAGE